MIRLFIFGVDLFLKIVCVCALLTLFFKQSDVDFQAVYNKRNSYPRFTFYLFYSYQNVLFFSSSVYICFHRFDAYTFMAMVVVTGHFDWIKCYYCYYLLNKYTKRLRNFDLLREEMKKKLWKWDIIQFSVNLTDRWMDEWPNRAT